MRTLSYQIDIQQFKRIKEDIVPTLFTEHQFQLAIKRFANRKLTQTERNEFSRTISRKMKAINAITQNRYVYGEERIIRLNVAKHHLKVLSRKFKNRQIIISGSFLYSKNYNDIDVFVISKYQKNNYKIGQYHINYLTNTNSAFFKSVSKLCITNQVIKQTTPIDVSLDKLISLYQEISNDYTKKIIDKNALREFIIQSAIIGGNPVPDSKDLKKQTDSITSVVYPMRIIRNIMTNTLIISKSTKHAKTMIESYHKMQTEYPQHKEYYNETAQPFKDALESIQGGSKFNSRQRNQI